MLVHGGISHGDAWAYLRDHLKGTTPYAQECIEASRTYTPPTMVEMRRIQRPRPEIRPDTVVRRAAMLDRDLFLVRLAAQSKAAGESARRRDEYAR